jgi:hypothetical protein
MQQCHLIRKVSIYLSIPLSNHLSINLTVKAIHYAGIYLSMPMEMVANTDKDVLSNSKALFRFEDEMFLTLHSSSIFDIDRDRYMDRDRYTVPDAVLYVELIKCNSIITLYLSIYLFNYLSIYLSIYRFFLFYYEACDRCR